MTGWLTRSIAQKLLAAFLAIFVATYIATAITVFTGVRSSIIDSQVGALETLANQQLGGIIASLDALSTNLRAWSKLDVMNDIPSGDVDKRIASSLRALRSDYRLAGQLYVFDADDALIAATTEAPDTSGSRRPPQWAMQDHDVTFVHKVESPFEPGLIVAITLPIYASFNPNLRLGVLVATVPWETIRAHLDQSKLHTILFDRLQQSVVDSVGIAQMDAGQLQELGRQTRRVSLDGAPHVAGYSSLAPEFARGWQVIALRDIEDVSAPVISVALQLTGLGGALAIPIFLLVTWISRRITRPIRDLQETVSTITRSGDLSKRVAVKTRDELGALASAFNEMALSLQTASAGREKALSDVEALNLGLEKRVAERTSDLEKLNQRLAGLSEQLSRYLSPQIYQSIFEGRQAAEISTKRKQLTVFFSDIKDFTSTTENLQPEELNFLLNDYLTRMTAIALEYGATIDKYIGDAILVFFGDPTTRGAKEDAVACVKMAIKMQREMVDLRAKWIDMGNSRPLHMRIGINTGFCNVGNFGSDRRMDYTIIGAEVNLAARLEGLCAPDGIVISEHTFQLVKDEIDAAPQEPVQVKGISKPVMSYSVVGIFDEVDRKSVIRSQAEDLRLFIDLRNLSDARRQAIADELEADAALLRRQK